MTTFSSPSATRSDALADYFSAHPATNLLVVEFGHAYGRAKFGSTCRLTRTQIKRGEEVRRIVVATRSGRIVEVYVANRTFGILVGAATVRIEFGSDAHGYPLRIDALPVRYTRFTGVETLEALDLDSVEGEVTVELVTRYGEVKKFVRGSRGKWNGRRSTKAFLAGVRRSRNYRLVRVSVRTTDEYGLGPTEFVAFAA